MVAEESLIARIRQANQDRRADMLSRKYKAMRESAFRFFRATPYLFYQDWSAGDRYATHPVSWVCADLHLENVGSYRAANGLVYFDINDFDEALLAPCTVDVARLVASLFVAAPLLKQSRETIRHLALRFVTVYTRTLQVGKPQSVERETAAGLLKQFLNQVANRSRKDLIARFTHGRGNKCQLIIDDKRLFKLSPSERATVWPWLHHTLYERGGYRLRDVVFRVAGTNSIGLSRYVALVEAPAGKLHLIDMKATRPSVAEPYVGIVQPGWPDSATRVVTLQNRLQDVPPALLWAETGPDGEFFVGRTLQPQADRLDLTSKRVRSAVRLGQLVETIAQLTASAHLRSGGHQGSAIADELIEFATNPTWSTGLIDWAEAYAGQVQTAYRHFKATPDADLIGPGNQL